MPPADPILARRLAELARLELPDDQTERWAADLAQILRYVKKLEELDTQNIDPITHPHALPSRLRTDEAEPSVDPEEALSNAPERLANGFGVPEVIK